METSSEALITKRIIKETTETKSDHTSKINQALSHYIGTLQQAPKFIQDELSYINQGYRVNFTKKRLAVKSLFMWHNEFVNIWTHLLGAVFVISLIFYISTNYTQLWKDKAMVEINERFQKLYEDVKTFDTSLDDQLGYSYQSLTRLKNEFGARVDQFSLEYLLSEQTKKEIEDIKSQFLQEFNDKTQNFHHEISTAYALYQSRIVEIVQSKDFDWIDLYKKLSNKSEKDLQKEEENTDISRWPIFAFLLSAVACLLSSSIFHCFYCISPAVYKVLIRLDYAGICFLISGSTYAPYFYGFYCNKMYAIIYSGFSCMSCFIVFIISLQHFIHTEKYRHLKSKMFAALGISNFLGCIHLGIASNDIVQGYSFVTHLPYYVLIGIAYLGGLSIFQARWPENKKTGQFDNCGHSHQLWHISVIIGVFLTYIATLNAYYARIDSPCSAFS